MTETPHAVNRPAFVTDKMLHYLDDLRLSGRVNMFGARPFVLRAFPRLTDKEAAKVLTYWMQTFAARHGH